MKGQNGKESGTRANNKGEQTDNLRVMTNQKRMERWNEKRGVG